MLSANGCAHTGNRKNVPFAILSDPYSQDSYKTINRVIALSLDAMDVSMFWVQVDYLREVVIDAFAAVLQQARNPLGSCFVRVVVVRRCANQN